MMGGTRFIGVYLTKILVEQGHSVVLFNRGNKPAPVEGVEQIHGDRTDESQLKENSPPNNLMPFSTITDGNSATPNPWLICLTAKLNSLYI